MPPPLRLEAMRADQLDAARTVIRAGALEFFGAEPAAFDDMDRSSAVYAPPAGVFLVLMDGDTVVGTGGIRRMDSSVCELKRMWLLPEYRGRGYGRQMAERLLVLARSAGYRRVRLDTDPKLVAANHLYARLGFRPIERYNSGPCTLFMERDV